MRLNLHDGEPRDIPPHIPPFSLRGALSPLLVVPIVLAAVVTLVAPVDVLDRWPAAQLFTEWVQRMVPFMNMRAHADSTIYPQVAWLTHSVTIVLIPLLSLVWLWQSIVNYPVLLARRRAPGRLTIKQHVLGVIGVPLFLGAVYASIAMPGDPSFATGFTTHSRGGLAFLTVLMQYLTSMVLGGQLPMLRLFIDTYLRKGA